MALASALTLGATSDWELCQCDLAAEVDPVAMDAAMDRLKQQLPVGIQVTGLWGIPLEKRNPYIQVKTAVYELTLSGECSEERLRQFLQEKVPQSDIGSVVETSDRTVLQVGLPVGERDGVRIRDLVAELEKAFPEVRVVRLHRARLWCELEPATTEIAGGASR